MARFVGDWELGTLVFIYFSLLATMLSLVVCQNWCC